MIRLCCLAVAIAIAVGAPGARAAEAIVMDTCPATGELYTADACPCQISSVTPGPNVGNTTADVDFTLSGGAACIGDAHVCLEPLADGNPGRDNCINNTAILDKEIVPSSGAGSYTLTGATALTGNAEAQHRVYVHVVPSGTYADRPTHGSGTSATFSTNAAPGGGGPDISGDGLFVAKNDLGNTDETTGSTDGLSSPAGCTQHFNSPCAELSELSPATGQNVSYAEGATWNGDQLTISVGGNASDPAVHRCYYNNAGTPNQCGTYN